MNVFNINKKQQQESWLKITLYNYIIFFIFFNATKDGSAMFYCRICLKPGESAVINNVC
jgi:hypothetical protein